MNVYAADTQVTLVVPMVDSAGNALSVTAVDYRVIDEAGAELVARVALGTFVSGDTEATIVIDAVDNALGVDALRTARQVDLFLTLEDANEITIRSIYVLEALETVVVGVNSFQSYLDATLTARDIGSTDGWDAATEEERMAALRNARDRLCELHYSMVGVAEVNAPAGGYGYGEFRLDELTVEQFNALPAQFLTALKKAQIAEADDILDADPITEARRKGLMLETIGEVKQMYRGTKPLLLPISRRAAEYIGRYVSFSLAIGRA